MARLFVILVSLASFVTAHQASAEITDQNDIGFTIKHEAVISAPAQDVWKALIAPARYWNKAHSWTGDSSNFYLVPQAGGCFCELIRKTGDDNIKSSDGSVQHMRVIFAQKNKILRMSGSLGPLQGEALAGTLTMQLQPDGDKTAARFTYKVGGYMEFKIDEIAPAVDGVIGEQLTRLAALFKEEEPKPEAEPNEEEAPAESSEEDSN